MPFQPLRTFFAFFLISLSLFGQSGNIPYSSDYYHLLERYEVKSGQLANDYHVNVKPFERRRVASYLEAMETDSMGLSKVDSFNLNYLKQDSWEWLKEEPAEQSGLWNLFFKQKSDFYHFKNEDFDIHVNPVFHFGGGRNSYNDVNAGQFINTRGIKIRGSVNSKLGFYSFFSENQASSPAFIKEYFKYAGGFPYNGFTKIVDLDEQTLKRDYIQAEGYLTFSPSKSIMLRLGHSKNFIGSGVRSMILSDFSAPYFNFAANVKLGRLEYQNILAKMNNRQDDFDINDYDPIPPKFMVFHHLNLNLNSNFNFGLFEAVMFGDRKFDMNYLNPVIFYRFVEGLIGSSDNALVGADFKLNVAKRFSFYGQLVLDEFNRTENKNGNWYGKKNSKQIGVKYFDFLGIRQFDVQYEFNSARPYTYSHHTTYGNLVNYNLPIAHPLGANFKESILIARWQPAPKVFLKATYLHYTKGFDIDSLNYGGNIFLNNRENLASRYNVNTTQGLKRTLNLFRLESSYMISHNFFVDLSWQKRTFVSEESASLFNFGIRWNYFKEDYLF